MSVALESKKDAIAALEESANVKFSYDKDSKPVLQDAPAQAGKPAKSREGGAGEEEGEVASRRRP